MNLIMFSSYCFLDVYQSTWIQLIYLFALRRFSLEVAVENTNRLNVVLKILLYGKMKLLKLIEN